MGLARVTACSYPLSTSRLRLAVRVTCLSTSLPRAVRARSSPVRSASAIAPSAAPAAIAPLAAFDDALLRVLLCG